MGNESTPSAAPEPVYGKPFHGWSCECDECQGYDERGEPRPGEAPATSAAKVKHPPCKDGMEHRWSQRVICPTRNWPKSYCLNDCGTVKLWP